MTDEELAGLFVRLAFEKADVLNGDDLPAQKAVFRKIELVRTELRSRGTDARRILLPLIDQTAWPKTDAPFLKGGVAQAQYEAAWELLAIEPEKARALLAVLAAGRFSRIRKFEPA